MPRKARRRIPPSTGLIKTQPQSVDDRASVFRVLLVDRDLQVRKQLSQALADDHIELEATSSLVEARTVLRQNPVDLVLIEPNLSDGSGMALAQELSQMRSATQTIVMTDQPDLDSAIETIRAGACDLIAKPINLDELNERVSVAIARHKANQKDLRRIKRLRRICKKLNGARAEVTQQVDVLCNDLVTAYQKLAAQMQNVVQTNEFAILMRNELDLEQLLRKTLEYLVQKAGPANAAIFLPAMDYEYSLGGYVNYDCSADSADVLLQHLADVVAPLIAQRDVAVHITDNTTLTEWIDDDVAYLADSHLVGFNCLYEDETLAVVVLFRDASQPFNSELIETATVIAPLLGDALARIIRVHHRHIGDPYDID